MHIFSDFIGIHLPQETLCGVREHLQWMRKEIFKIIGITKAQGTLRGRTAESHSEREVLQMQKESIEKAAQLDGTDEELIDVLIAISVVAKRLARKLQNEQKGECQHEQNE